MQGKAGSTIMPGEVSRSPAQRHHRPSRGAGHPRDQRRCPEQRVHHRGVRASWHASPIQLEALHRRPHRKPNRTHPEPQHRGRCHRHELPYRAVLPPQGSIEAIDELCSTRPKLDGLIIQVETALERRVLRAHDRDNLVQALRNIGELFGATSAIASSPRSTRELRQQPARHLMHPSPERRRRAQPRPLQARNQRGAGRCGNRAPRAQARR